MRGIVGVLRGICLVNIDKKLVYIDIKKKILLQNAWFFVAKNKEK